MPESIQERLIEWAVDMEWHNFNVQFQRNQYYIPYPHMLRKCYGLSMNDRGVLFDIMSHLGENDEAFPSTETIFCNLASHHVDRIHPIVQPKAEFFLHNNNH
ncbi:hypothetical protein MKY42_23790 [Paenibacillus sp. FSL W7-1088]|uniref:hypothetical protein n=1 Tax=unclassified Paenibacillus TaxID=185978 RepID=UPI0015C5B55B|nr:hypothetical protein [Paenibacillus sp. E222]QLG39185.1 hypothetical protein HW560_14540 [Paenibacillus sp. E222]